MAIEEKALENVLDKLSGIRATMNKDERHALDLIVMRSQSGEGDAEVEAHAINVQAVDMGAAEVSRFNVFALEAGSIRLKDDAYALIETAR
jgi:hypothetical protein